MERSNNHRHVHNQCARARDYVHVFDFCYDWMMATKACKFALVRRSLNLEAIYIVERLSGIKVWHASTGAADMFVNWRARHGSQEIKSIVGTKMKENPVVYELLKITNRKMTTVRTNT